MKSPTIEISTNRLIVGIGLVFLLGLLFAVINGYYTEEFGESLPLIVYGTSIISILLGGILILLFQTKINKMQLNSVLSILPKDEAAVIKTLIEHNKKLEQNHLVAYTGLKKVRISRVLKKYEQKGLIEKKDIGNTNLIVLKL